MRERERGPETHAPPVGPGGNLKGLQECVAVPRVHVGAQAPRAPGGDRCRGGGSVMAPQTP